MIMLFGNIVLILGAAIFLSAAALSRRPGPKRRLAIAATATLSAIAIAYFAGKPVYRDDLKKPSTLTVYLGITDEAVISATRQWAIDHGFTGEAKTVNIVGVEGAEAMVRNLWPQAHFLPQKNWTHGVTLEKTVEDLATRLQSALKTGMFVVAGPRAANLGEMHVRFGELLQRYPDLATRLYFLYSGVELPAVGGLAITAPSSLAAGSAAWPVTFRTQPGKLSGDLEIAARLYDPSVSPSLRGLEIAEPKIRVYSAADAPPVTLPSPKSPADFKERVVSGNLPPPTPSNPAAVMVELRTKFEPLLFSTAFASQTKPQLLVLQKKGSDPKENALYNFCAGLGLDVRLVTLNLTDKAQLPANANALSDFPVLLVGEALDKTESDLLFGSVALQSPSASLFFAGSGRTASNPKGWLETALQDFRADLRPGMLREVGIAYDNSPSMGEKLPDGRTRFAALDKLIKNFKAGFAQRNTGFIFVMTANDFTPLSKFPGYTPPKISGWMEAGIALTKFNGLVGKHPFSDIVIFLDPTDVEDDGRFSQDHINAAKSLEDHGCRIHFVSVGGAMDSRNPKYMNDFLRLQMNDYRTVGELDGAMERLLYNKVLPRLTVEVNPDGLNTQLQDKKNEEQRAQLAKVAQNPALRIIDALGGPLDDSSPATPNPNVLLWAKLGEKRATPLLVRRSVNSLNVTWLNAVIESEAAIRMHEDKSAETTALKAALSDLFIASTSVASTRLKSSPVSFFPDPDGHGVLAIIDTNQPFRLASTSFVGERGAVATLDDRDLGELHWHIQSTGEPYVPERYEIQVSDDDERVGSATQTIRVFGPPPVLISSERVAELVNHKFDTLGDTTPASAPKGIPRSWYGGFIALLVCLAAFIVNRT